MKPLNGRVHDGSSKQTFLFESFCVISAYGLIAVHGYRLSQNAAMWNWSCILAIACGWIAADFVSGLVHWLADTWGSETMPWIGPRFLKPFRVHHTTPESFLECKFMDTNGDTALIGIPFLLSVFAVPLTSHWGFWFALFLTSFCLFALPTNQIHQWAHMSRPPRFVRWLQASGLILSTDSHGLHHSGAHSQHYCITTGFCNRLLERICFFRILENAISRCTGLQPRSDEMQHWR